MTEKTKHNTKNKRKGKPFNRVQPQVPRFGKKVIFEATNALTYYAQEFKEARANMTTENSTNKERQNAQFMMKNLNLLKQFAVEQMVRDRRLHFEAFVIQKSLATNKRYLLTRFVDSRGEQRYSIPSKVEDLVLLREAFTVEPRETSSYEIDWKPAMSMNHAINILSIYTNKDVRMINGWRSSIWNGFNCEDMMNADGVPTPEFPMVMRALEELKLAPSAPSESEEKYATKKDLDKHFKDKNFKAPDVATPRHRFTIRQRG